MKINHPLMHNNFTKQDLNKVKELFNKKNIILTQSEQVKKFEKKWSEWLGVKHSVFVNSGSSANYITIKILDIINKDKNKNEIIVPALTWVSDISSVIMNGFKPIFVDINLNSLSMDLDQVLKKINKRTLAIFITHAQGFNGLTDEFLKVIKKKNIYLIEDNCESLGSVYKGKNLGTFGDFSTFSFYYSHQLTAGEGGMIVCSNKSDYKILQSLRAHGWDREISKRKNTFNFINQGFNLRPLDISASIAMSQLKRLKKMVKTRKFNRDMIIKFLKKSPKWDNQFTFFEPSKYLKPSWFSIPLLINRKYLKFKKTFLNKLEKNKIETRPIISGNFINQPAIKLHKLRFNKNNFKISQEIEDRGFFIGLPTKKINLKDLKKLTDCLLDFK